MDELLAAPLEELLDEARHLRAGDGLVTYSPKVFVPLTTLCRDVCGYCTFARPPRRGERAFMALEQVLEIARAGVAAGCHEALFTLGDKPELRYRVARDAVAQLGLVAEREQRLVTAGRDARPRDLQYLLERHEGPLAAPRRTGEGAVAAHVAAERRQWDEHLGGIGDE